MILLWAATSAEPLLLLPLAFITGASGAWPAVMRRAL
jgi:hypothetical protein